MATPTPTRSPVSALLQSLDLSSARLAHILTNPAGIDKFLLTIYYTLKLVYPQFTRLRALTSPSKLSPALTPGSVQRASALTSSLLALETSSRNLAAICSEARIIARLWGLLGLYRWARGTYVSPPRDAGIVWAQIGACTVYQVLENGAYLAGKGVLRGEWCNAEKQGRWWVLSCRWWLAHVVLEAVRLLRERARRGEHKGEGDGEIKREREAWARTWWANMGYLPIALHYSFADGLISDEVLGACGLVNAYNTFGHMWKMSKAVV